MSSLTCSEFTERLLKRLDKLRYHLPDVARAYYNNPKSYLSVVDPPEWYTSTGSSMVVNTREVSTWVLNNWPLPNEHVCTLLGKSLDPLGHQYAVDLQQEIMTGERRCVGPELAPLSLDTPCIDHRQKSLNQWNAFVPRFMASSLGSKHAVRVAKYYMDENAAMLSLIPASAAQSIIDAVATALPKITTIGVNKLVNGYDADDDKNYPLNRLLQNWIRSYPGKNHELVAQLAAMFWLYYESHPPIWGMDLFNCSEEEREIKLASRAQYSAYALFSHELLRSYPQLIWTISSLDALDQIQMEHDLFHSELDAMWVWASSTMDMQTILKIRSDAEQGIQDSLVTGVTITYQDLVDAGVDTQYLLDIDRLKDVFNSADTPVLTYVQINTLPTYRVHGKVFTASPPRLVTYEDQLRFQGPNISINLKAKKQEGFKYPLQIDVLEQHRQYSLAGTLTPTV